MSDLDSLFGVTPGTAVMPGVTVGVVTNNRDPERAGRVKLRFPALSSTVESTWASLVTVMAGGGRGLYLVPEVGDTVLVAFEHGDVNRPFVLGSFWSMHDPPPETPAPDNDHRVLRSRSGHQIHLDDTDGAGRIEIVDSTGNNRIAIDTTANRITVHAAGPIEIAADGDLHLSAAGSLSLSGRKVSVRSDTDIDLAADGKANLTANGPLTLRGATVDIN